MSLGHVVVIVRSGHAVVLCLAVIVSSRHAVFSLALALLLVSSIHVDRCSFSHDVHIAVRLFSRTVLLCSCLLQSIQLFLFCFLFFNSFIPTHTPVPFFSSSYTCSFLLQLIQLFLISPVHIAVPLYSIPYSCSFLSVPLYSNQ